MFMWMWLLLLNLITGIAVPATSSAEANLSRDQALPNPTTNITAKTMTVSNQENKAIFDGSVVLTRGELVVYSDHMVVSFRPGENGSESKKDSPANIGKNGAATGKKEMPGRDAMPSVSDRSISKIEATGRVKIEKEGGRATCRRAVYFEEERKIVLTGEPIAWQKGTRVTGKQITMFLDEDRSVVEGGSHVTIEADGGSSQ